MADCINPVYDILTRLCGCCAKRADSIRQLGGNLNSLRKASSELNGRYLDVKMRVETAEKNPDPELMVLNEVRNWMGRVEVLQNEVQAILPKVDQEIQAKCFGGRCPKNCRARYKLHKTVTQMLSDVNDLLSKGHFDVVAENFARDLFEELPVDKVVGVESTFEMLCSYFEDNKVGTIGLYGQGGVGKTTLLKKFNNDFLSTKPHYVVIWIVASKDADPGKIQDGIKKKLRVKDNHWEKDKTVDEMARLLYNILNTKKFVLLLDDVWERIDLVNLGVPSPDNHECKIIFTTRSDDVCSRMDAKRRIKVNCLTREKAFELFKEKVGETTLENRRILELAEQVVDKCKGLPLALCTVGRAMANKVTRFEWSQAVDILSTRPSKLQGIVKDVYYLLEFSYNALSESFKSYFLYCALFPQDDNISKEDIIWLWMAEGYLGNDIHEARKQGEDIISNLKSACLLEDGEMCGTIKMHDVIRDVALWIACDHDEKSRFISRDCSNARRLDHARWAEVEKLSMWGSEWDGMITKLSQKPDCPNLATLLVRGTWIQVFPTEMFVIPSTIKVLDLAYTDGIANLPSEIGKFVNLEHLNLSHTGIQKLPEELKKLKKLRFLLLNDMSELQFPKDVISSLLSLEAFGMLARRGHPVIDDENEALLLQDLEGLDHLQDIRITVRNISSAEKILKSSRLLGRMCGLFVEGRSLHHDLISSLVKMEHLEELKLYDGDFVAVNIPGSSFWEHKYRSILLRRLTLVDCKNMVDLNWLVHAPNLEVLVLINNTDSLKEVISENFGTATGTEGVKRNCFSSLTYLSLFSLFELSSICRMPLQFPCLEHITVANCPNLKKLPFNSQSALKNLSSFQGNSGLLDQLEWEDDATKNLFSSKFQVLPW